MVIPRRLVHTFATAALTVMVVVAAGSCGEAHPKLSAPTAARPARQRSDCNVGNPVTQMGYPIGTVTSNTPDVQSVRVDFTPLPIAVLYRATPEQSSGRRRFLPTVRWNSSAITKRDPSSNLATAFHSRGRPHPRAFPKSSFGNEFLNAINPSDSTNIADVVRELDHAIEQQRRRHQRTADHIVGNSRQFRPSCERTSGRLPGTSLA